MQKKKDNSSSLQKQEIETVIAQAVEKKIDERLTTVVEQITQTEFFSGPLPHPETARQ